MTAPTLLSLLDVIEETILRRWLQ